MEAQEAREVSLFEEEASRLAAKPHLVRLEKDGEEFYFDSTDLSDHRDDFIRMRQEGWRITEEESLVAYHPARIKMLEERGLIPEGWGYKKTTTR